MNMIAIASIDVNQPKPFTANPFTTLVLCSQVGTLERYIRVHAPNADMDMIEAEARAIEMVGGITQTDLDADWKIDVDFAAAEEAEIASARFGDAFDDEGMPVEEEDGVQEIEPVA